MKLRDIKEAGFYREVKDTERKTVFEICENTDEDWLKEDPKATLLIDTWLYEYQDENDRSVYFTNGDLPPAYLDISTIDVVKIEGTNYKVFGEYGQLLVEDKPTYKEQLEALQVHVKDLERKLEVAEGALDRIISSDKCNRCDGIGYDAGCSDEDCEIYIAQQALQKMEINYDS